MNLIIINKFAAKTNQGKNAYIIIILLGFSIFIFRSTDEVTTKINIQMKMLITILPFVK